MRLLRMLASLCAVLSLGVSAVAQRLPFVTYQGTYNASTPYAVNDTVTYAGSTYISLIPNNKAVTPGSNGADWQLYGAGAEGSTAWGNIGGSLSAQADLTAALASKAPSNATWTVNGQTWTLGGSYTISGGSGSGSVTSFGTGTWPSWLTPVTTNGNTTPTLGVTASAIPNSALANPSITINGTSVPLGGSTTISGATALGQLTGIDGVATSDRRNNVFEQMESSLIAHSIITPYPSDGSTMHGAGSEYSFAGTFPADEYYSISGAPSAYSPADKLNAITKHLALVDSNGNIPQTVLPNGTVFLWDSAYDGNTSSVNGQPVKHLMGESAQFLSAILRFYVDDCAGTTTSAKCAVSGATAYSTYAPILARAMTNFVRDPGGNNLIYVASGNEWIPCDGYTESWRVIGDSPCGSVWTAKAYTDLAYAATKSGDATNATTYSSAATAIINSLSSLLDTSNGDLFYFSSTQTSIHDVRDSVYACYFGFLSQSQCSAMGSYLHSHLSSLMMPNGYVRVVDGSNTYIGTIASNGTASYGGAGLNLTGYNYQSGGWGYPMGAFAYTLGVSGNQTDVATMLTDYYSGTGIYVPGLEWVDGNSPASTPTPCSTSGCASNSGTTVPIAHLMSSASGAAIAANLFPVAVNLTWTTSSSSSELTSAIAVNSTNDVYFGTGNYAGSAGSTLTHTGEYISWSHTTTPTGSCALNGMWAFPQSGSPAQCLSNTWTASGPSAGVTSNSGNGYTLGNAVSTNGTYDVFFASGAQSLSAGSLLTHTGEYFSGGHATTPTGTCGLNGMWSFNQNGTITWCNNSWTLFGGGSGGATYGTPTIPTLGNFGPTFVGSSNHFVENDSQFVLSIDPTTNISAGTGLTVAFSKSYTNNANCYVQPTGLSGAQVGQWYANGTTTGVTIGNGGTLVSGRPYYVQVTCPGLN